MLTDNGNIHDNPMIQALKNVAVGKKYESPRELVTEAIKYFKYCDQDQNWYRQEWVGKDGIEVARRVKTPYSISGFLAFTGLSIRMWGIIKDEKYRESQEGRFSAKERELFKDVALQIESIIANDQLSGAMTGHYNHNIVSRLQGLTDKKDITSNGESIGAVKSVAVELPEGMDLKTEMEKNSKIEDAEIIEEKTEDKNLRIA